MKKNDVFTFTAPNGVEVTAVVVDNIARWWDFNGVITIVYLCYAQNRLFTWKEEFKQGELIGSHYGRVAIDYATLPYYDELLKTEQQKFEDDCYEALSSIGDVEF